MSLEKMFDEISNIDILSLLESETPEGKTIEYKESLPQNNHEGRKEFLADISSFANTSGGHILFGIKEESGIPVNISGFSNIDFDKEILLLENIIRDSIEPRISGISMKKISGESVNPVLLIRIPQSWSKPHAVNYGGHWRFYSRNSAGKYPLDVLELKSAFIGSTSLGEKIRNFHLERLNKIVSGETPVHIADGGKFVFHLIPFVAFEPGFNVNLDVLQKDIWSMTLIEESSISGYRYNLDGIVTYNDNNENAFGSYLQVFRNGIIEMVDTSILKPHRDERRIPSIVFEREIILLLMKYIAIQQKLSMAAPFTLILSLAGVKGYKMAVSSSLQGGNTHVIDRDLLILPEVVAEDYHLEPKALLRPIFDAVWNSAGWAKSFGYDEKGEWGKGRNFIR